jgi:hypothetical protein
VKKSVQGYKHVGLEKSERYEEELAALLSDQPEPTFQRQQSLVDGQFQFNPEIARPGTEEPQEVERVENAAGLVDVLHLLFEDGTSGVAGQDKECAYGTLSGM